VVGVSFITALSFSQIAAYFDYQYNDAKLLGFTDDSLRIFAFLGVAVFLAFSIYLFLDMFLKRGRKNRKKG